LRFLADGRFCGVNGWWETRVSGSWGRRACSIALRSARRGSAGNRSLGPAPEDERGFHVHGGDDEPERAGVTVKPAISDAAHVAPLLHSHEDRLELKRSLGAGLPKTYIACTNPDDRPNAAGRQWVKTRPDWTSFELATGHDAMILAPDALTEMLMREA
jgi:hypothetical protein